MYPVFFNIRGKRCLVVGGGTVAERKIYGLLTEQADVVVVSPEVTTSIARLAAHGQCCWLKRTYCAADLHGVFFVFAATDSPAVQQQIAVDAEASGIPVNVVDKPELCTFHVPAVLRRGDLTLAVSTAGKSPALAAMVRQKLSGQYGEEYEQLLLLMGKLRPLVLAVAGTSDERKTLFQNILHDDIIYWIEAGRWDKIRSHLRALLGPGVDMIINGDMQTEGPCF